MAMRLSGLSSGMDTESIVKELMKAQRMKTEKINSNITKLEWTKDKWKDLNTKLYSFYTGSLSKLRLQGSYNTKNATSSNVNKIDIKAGSTATEGSHSVKVKEMASAQFVTGSKIGTDINGKLVTTNTKLTDLGFLASEGTSVKIQSGDKNVTLEIGASTTINDFTNALKNAGINASYDANQNRFFISSKQSGYENAFSITSTASEYTQDRNAIRDYLNYGTLSASGKTTVDSALDILVDPISVPEDKAVAKSNLLAISHDQVRKDYIQNYISNQDNIDSVTDSERVRLEAELQDGETLNEDVLKAAVDQKLLADAGAAATAEYEAWESGTAPGTNLFTVAEAGLDNLISNYVTDSGVPVLQTNSLSLLGLSEIVTTTNGDGTVSVSGDSNVAIVAPSDATIVYNGAELTSSSNTITANGLTFTLKGITNGWDTADTSDDEVITLNVTNDTQAVYDMVKGFVKTYNELLTAMNEAFGAVSAKGFEPLTDDQKGTMSESQIDKWEEKIKASLLRRDTTLDSITSSMRSTMTKGVMIDGKIYSLSSFGIGSANYIEKGLLHINGDEDDSIVSGRTNNLMATLLENPDLVKDVMTKLTGELFLTMTDSMKSTTLSSALTFYNDKDMTKSITNYKSSLSKLEEKLKKMEDRYFKQFASMETALAKINSQSSSLAAMLGTNTNK